MAFVLRVPLKKVFSLNLKRSLFVGCRCFSSRYNATGILSSYVEPNIRITNKCNLSVSSLSFETRDGFWVKDSNSTIKKASTDEELSTKTRTDTDVTAQAITVQAMPISIVEGGKYVAHFLRSLNDSDHGIHKVIVFVRSKLLAEDLALQLMEYGLQADALTARTGQLLEEMFLPSETGTGIEQVVPSDNLENDAKEETAISEKDILQRFIADEFNVMVTTESESWGMKLPKVDMIIQVQQCFKNPATSLYYLDGSHYRKTHGKAIYLYNNDDLKFLSEIQRQIEIQKILPPSFYNDQDFSFAKREKSLEKDIIPYEDEPLIPRDYDAEPRIMSQPVKSKKLPKFEVFSPLVKIRVSDRQPMSDFVRLYVRGGTGGQGCQKSGMIGGDGGDVILQCRPGSTLDYFRVKENRRLIASNGTHCISGRNWGPMKLRYKATRGERGKNLIVPVPQGTIIYSEDGELLVELINPNDRYIISLGGRGGSAFNVDWNGEKGETRMIRLELKLIADVGLVGFPNAGKSSLLRSLTRAKPRVGDFAFTSVRPSLGVLQYPDHDRVTIADLPGLLEGAHLNKGLGIKFLKHVERTGMLVFVVDISGFQLNYKYSPRSAFESVCLLMKELELYASGLSSRPKVLVVNKMDTEGAEEKLEDLLKTIEKVEENKNLNEVIFGMDVQNYEMDARKAVGIDYYENEFSQRLEKLKQFDFQGIFGISAADGVGIDELKQGIKKICFLEEERQRKYSSHYF